MFKVYVLVRDDEGEIWKNMLDGSLYPDIKTAHNKLKEAIEDDHLEDFYDITGYLIEEAVNEENAT